MTIKEDGTNVVVSQVVNSNKKQIWTVNTVGNYWRFSIDDSILTGKWPFYVKGNISAETILVGYIICIATYFKKNRPLSRGNLRKFFRKSDFD